MTSHPSQPEAVEHFHVAVEQLMQNESLTFTLFEDLPSNKCQGTLRKCNNKYSVIKHKTHTTKSFYRISFQGNMHTRLSNNGNIPFCVVLHSRCYFSLFCELKASGCTGKLYLASSGNLVQTNRNVLSERNQQQQQQ